MSVKQRDNPANIFPRNHSWEPLLGTSASAIDFFSYRAELVCKHYAKPRKSCDVRTQVTHLVDVSLGTLLKEHEDPGRTLCHLDLETGMSSIHRISNVQWVA